LNSSRTLRAAATGQRLATGLRTATGRWLATGVWLAAVAALAAAAPTVRLKDVASLQGLRGNQLVGIGLVTGLAGRGDSSNSALLRNAVANLVSNFGFRIAPAEVRSRNCAVVSVSAEVPAFLNPGAAIDVKVASLGDARSLEGGILLQTPLKAANGRVYALAQGQVFTIGEGSGTRTVGSIPGGAIAEQQILSTFLDDFRVSLALKNPDFLTASAVADAIRQAFPDIRVSARDASLVALEIPEDRRRDPVGFIAQLEGLQITPDPSNKVVIDASTGIIIFGEQVRIGKVGVSYKDISVQVGAVPAFRLGLETSPNKPEQFTLKESTTVEELVDALRTVGLDTETVIQLIKAVDKAGALFGVLVIL
jgi:flagellar P-ring protein precursor FlgI